MHRSATDYSKAAQGHKILARATLACSSVDTYKVNVLDAQCIPAETGISRIFSHLCETQTHIVLEVWVKQLQRDKHLLEGVSLLLLQTLHKPLHGGHH